MAPIIFIVVVVSILAGSAWFSRVKNKKRTEALRKESEAMGLQFNPDGNEVRDRFSEFNLMNRGRAKKAKNLISGDAGDVKISIFDYQYTTGSGKNSRTTLLTVVALESAGIQAPSFSMRRQNAFLDKIGKFFGGQDIDFEGHPVFSKMFVLKGPDEDAIRRFFTPTLLTFFETKVGDSVEGALGKMILYKGRTSENEIKDMLASAYEVYGHIVDGE